MRRKAFFWLLLIAMIGLWAYKDTLFPSEVIHADSAKVTDGDTLVIDRQAYRLHGIDAPEYHQLCKEVQGKYWPCGKAARLQLASFVAAGSISCAPQATDTYGRRVARCSSATVPDMGEAMVQAGLAISPAERGAAVYAEAETAARDAKRGIWQGEFDTPADWRAAHPRLIVTNAL
ncbi:MAG: thermonuclease family protein [Sphingomonadaceae bacterium]